MTVTEVCGHTFAIHNNYPSAQATCCFLLLLKKLKRTSFVLLSHYMGGCFCFFFVFLISAGGGNACDLFVKEKGIDIFYESVAAVNGRIRWPSVGVKCSFWAIVWRGNSTSLTSYCSHYSDITMHCLRSVSEKKLMVFWSLGKTEVWGLVDIHTAWLFRILAFFLFFHTS